jgi:DMSO reductase anchor subunit
MNPALSVVFLTTLAGAAQGLFLALVGVDAAAWLRMTEAPGTVFFVGGALFVVALAGLGLVASFFHLGRPERAWRSAAMWRTSWLSREVIALPAFIAVAALYGLAHWVGLRAALPIGLVGSIVCVGLFVCTGMIYACLRFLQEWHSPLTVVNFFVLGTASGLTLAAAFSALAAPALTLGYAALAWAATLVGLGTRAMSLARNARLRRRSTIQTAIGIRHPRIRQMSQGFMGGSFNTREFFHGRSRAFVRHVRSVFLLTAFGIPLVLLYIAGVAGSGAGLAAAFAIQLAGLVAERWYFFAEAKHPQNLYYQAIA